MKKNIKTPFANVSWEGTRFPPLGMVVFFVLANIIAFALVFLIVAFLTAQILSLVAFGASFWPIFWLVLAGVVVFAGLK